MRPSRAGKKPPQPPDVQWSSVVSATQEPVNSANTTDNTDFVDFEDNPNYNGGWGELWSDTRNAVTGAWQSWQDTISTPGSAAALGAH
jgi:hypothetical protein